MIRLLSTRFVLAGLCALVCAFNAAPSTTQPLQDQMLLAVADAADHGLTPVPDRALSGALARAHGLTSIQVDATGKEATIRLQVTGQPAFDIDLAADGTSVRLELADTIVVPELQTLTINNGNIVGDITAELSELHPQFITHVEFALAKPSGVRVHKEGQTLVLAVAPGAKGVTLNTTPSPVAAARAREMALRLDAQLQPDYDTIERILDRSHQALADARLALLETDLAEIAPAKAGQASGGDARADFERHQARTALLETDYRGLIARRTDALAQMMASVADVPETEADSKLDAFTASEANFQRALGDLQSKIEQQAESNALLARRFQQMQMPLTAAAQGSPKAGLERLDMAFAELRTEAPAAQGPSAQQASENMTAIDAASVPLQATRPAAMAVLKDDAAPTGPPAPRTPRSQHRISLDPVARPDKMAVLRSTDSQVASAEEAGVIKLAQQPAGVTDVQNGNPATQIREQQPTEGPRRYRVPKTTGMRPAFNLYNEHLPADEDPLRQLVNIDFRDMDLTNVVSLLAQKGQINVIAGTEVAGTVTANLKNIPLGRAIEIVLRMNGLGIVEEAGVYRITTYEEAVASQRETRMIFLKNAQSEEVKDTLDGILAGDVNGSLVSVSANPSTNVVIISGPLEAVEELESVVAELDVADPVIPTVTMPIKLNYSEPLQMLPVITPMVSDQGQVSADPRSRHLIVTDAPVKVQEIQALIRSIDLPVKQVSIDAMIVDAELGDDAETGVDWVINTLHRQGVDTDVDGEADIFPPDLAVSSMFPITNPQTAGTLAFGIISDSVGIRAEIAARVESSNSELLANPKVVTVENQPATINISEEIPYQELTQTGQGGQIASTEFKDVGTVLTVTPRVTHDNHVIVAVDAKQSNTTGVSVTGVPIEAKREASTTLRIKDGQSIFIGGLRSFDDETSNAKVPILGDIPGLNVLFKSQNVRQNHKELLIFLTTNVLPDAHYPELTPYQKERFDKLGGKPRKVDGTRELVNTYVHPEEYRDPIYKWRRTK